MITSNDHGASTVDGNHCMIFKGHWQIWSNHGSIHCHIISGCKGSTIITIIRATSYPKSVVIDDKTLWVTGDFFIGASTEYVTVTGTTHGPDLPMALTYHAMVAINSTCSMVIGGHSYLDYSYPDGYSASTFFYDHNEEEWINGPSLIQARSDHAAGIVTDEVTGEHFVTVTGGVGSGFFDSTEILQDGDWVQGKISCGYF